MKVIYIMLNAEITRLKKIVESCRERVQKAPLGFLRISNKESGTQYYLKNIDERKSNGKYIRKRDIGIACEIAQRDYDLRIINVAEKRINNIKQFLETYEKTELETIYQQTNAYRRQLLRDVILPDEEFVRRWQRVKYEGKTIKDDCLEIVTERGERVRSKSEKIIADKLYLMGIPYRYEYPLVLNGNMTIYPDFTILKMPERKEVYLEHLGMIDNEEYIEMTVNKIDIYEKNGIYIGDKLFLTHESSKKPLNTKILDGFIRKIFGAVN